MNATLRDQFSCVIPPTLRDRVRSKDRAARRQLDGGNAAREQHEQPITVLATKDTRIGCQRRNSLFEGLALIGSIWILIPDVGVIAAGEPDTKHDVCHEGTLAAAVLTCHASSITDRCAAKLADSGAPPLVTPGADQRGRPHDAPAGLGQR